MRVDDEGLHLPAELGERLAVELGGHRVWAVSPLRDGRAPAGGSRLVPWPDALRRFLHGTADVVLRSLEDDRILFAETVVLGTGTGRVRVVDAEGRPLQLDKAHHLSAMFADAGEDDRRALVDAVAQALADLRAQEVEGFLAYGNLLGAVRSGALIGHDNDADLAYLSTATVPVDVIRESFRLERRMQDAGWSTTRMSGGTFKLWADLPDGPRVGIDVFAAFYLDGLLHLMPGVTARLPREALLPVSTVTLEGRDLAGPARPEALLEATYGPGWRVPDPTFRFDTPRWLMRRIGGLFRGERRHRGHWDPFYEAGAVGVPEEPSAFARWVAAREPRPARLLDVGAGTGRDAIWLAGQGILVEGLDYSGAALAQASARARERAAEVRFRRLNLYDLRQTLTLGGLLAHDDRVDAVYARFLLDALEDPGRHNLWRFARSVLGGTRGRLYLEFRTAATDFAFGEHFRRLLDADLVCAELASSGFVVEHREEATGLAGLGDEDPRVARVVARREG